MKDILWLFGSTVTFEKEQILKNLVLAMSKLVRKQQYMEKISIKRDIAYLMFTYKTYRRENVWPRAVGLISKYRRKESRY